MTPNVVVLPGTSGPDGSPEYKEVYAEIEREAHRRGLVYKLVKYPGQDGKAGNLGYGAAVEAALCDCRRLNPTWLIARSFGCNVAAGALESREPWVADCRGAVLWGPFYKRSIEKDFGTPEALKLQQVKYRDYGVVLADDFFTALPELDGLMADVRCNIRLARGSADTYNTLHDLDLLRVSRCISELEFATDVIEVSGAEHKVVPQKIPTDVLSAYRRCLFEAFPLNRN